MKKLILKRALFGILIGINVTLLITIVISVCIGDGNFYFVVPEMAQCYGNEMNAVIIQTICSALMGAVMGISTVIWGVERISLLLQTIIHFVIICGAYVAVAYVCFWMEHNAWSVAGYVMMFAIVYAVIWIVQYIGIKKKLKKLNQRVAEG